MDYLFKSTMVLDAPNRNGLVYRQDNVVEALNRFLEKDIRPVLISPMLISCPDTSSIDLDKISGQVNHCWIEEDRILFSVTINDTPVGKMVKDLINTGVPLGLSSHSSGIVTTDSDMSVGLVTVKDFNSLYVTRDVETTYTFTSFSLQDEFIEV